jgi:hypothetical protein
MRAAFRVRPNADEAQPIVEASPSSPRREKPKPSAANPPAVTSGTAIAVFELSARAANSDTPSGSHPITPQTTDRTDDERTLCFVFIAQTL